MRFSRFNSFLALLFLSFFGFSQTEFQPFDIEKNEIQAHKIKSIKEFDNENIPQRYAEYDEYGNRIHFDSQNLQADYTYTFNENGYITEKSESELIKINALEIQTNHFNGKLATANYKYSFTMEIIEVFEQYFYNSNNDISEIAISFPPFDRKTYRLKYDYDEKHNTVSIQTFLVTEDGHSPLFQTYRQFNKKKELISELKIKNKKDTIDFKLFDRHSNLVSRKYNPNLIDPPKYTVNAELYTNFIAAYNTPLNLIFLHKNLDNVEGTEHVNLTQVKYIYNDKNLISEEHYAAKYLLKPVKKILFNDNLMEKTIIYPNKDTLWYRSTTADIGKYKNSVHVSLSPTKRSQIVIKKHIEKNNDLELIMEYHNHKRECKTFYKIDSSTATFQKASSCYSFRKQSFNPISKNQWSPSKPLNLIDLRQTDPAPKKYNLPKLNIDNDYTLNEEGDFVVMSQFDWQYLTSVFRHNDSLLIRQSIYKDENRTFLLHTFSYSYTDQGFQVQTRYEDAMTAESLGESISFFDLEGKIHKTTWTIANARGIEEIHYLYNREGLCTKKIVDYGYQKITTRFEYDFFSDRSE